jgi:hypothetical protein
MFLLRVPGSGSFSVRHHGGHRQEQRGTSHWDVAPRSFFDSPWAGGCPGHADRYAGYRGVVGHFGLY